MKNQRLFQKHGVGQTVSFGLLYAMLISSPAVILEQKE